MYNTYVCNSTEGYEWHSPCNIRIFLTSSKQHSNCKRRTRGAVIMMFHTLILLFIRRWHACWKLHESGTAEGWSSRITHGHAAHESLRQWPCWPCDTCHPIHASCGSPTDTVSARAEHGSRRQVLLNVRCRLIIWAVACVAERRVETP